MNSLKEQSGEQSVLTILCVLPVNDKQKQYFTAQAADKVGAKFIWSSYDEVTPVQASQADVIIGNVSPEIVQEGNRLAAAQNNGRARLRWIQLNSAGADAYLKEGVLGPDTILTCSAGAYGTSVSEHMIAMTFALVRRFDQYARQQTEHVWKTAGKVTSVDDATILVLGLGDIGGRYARAMAALGAHVIGVRRTLRSSKPDYLMEEHTIEDIDSLLPRADIVAMVLPGVAETRQIMNEKRLRLMKKGAYLINDGRGNAIDMAALKKVLREGHLGGVGLDVTDPEPLPVDDELWDMDRVIITPHIAGLFLLDKTFENVVRIAGENLAAFIGGQGLKHVVDRKRGY